MRCTLVLWLLSAGAVAACGGGDGGELGDSTCELAGGVGGELTWSSAGPPACAIPFGGDVGISMVFLPIDEPVAAFRVEVEEVTEGAIGTFPATVEIRAQDDRTWQSQDCTVDIDSHEFLSEDDFSREYLATGTGQCAGAAVAGRGGAGGELAVEPFAFRFTPHW